MELAKALGAQNYHRQGKAVWPNLPNPHVLTAKDGPGPHPWAADGFDGLVSSLLGARVPQDEITCRPDLIHSPHLGVVRGCDDNLWILCEDG